MALFPLADLAAYLQTDLDTASATVAQTIAAGVVTGYTGQYIESATYTHVLRVDSGLVVTLPQRPVTAVTSVATPDDGVLPSTDWDWDGASPWLGLTVEADIATVVYTAGYATVPSLVAAVALAVAGRAYTNAGGLRTESIDDYSVTYAGGGEDLASVGLTKPEKLLLDRYRVTAGTVVPR